MTNKDKTPQCRGMVATLLRLAACSTLNRGPELSRLSNASSVKTLIGAYGAAVMVSGKLGSGGVGAS